MNHPPFSRYGVPQGFWAVDHHGKISGCGYGPLGSNSLSGGELHPFSTAWVRQGQNRKSYRRWGCRIKSGRGSGVSWDEKFDQNDWHRIRANTPEKSVGAAWYSGAACLSGYEVPAKINEDGSLILVGATDLGTGSDTVLGQMAAEVLGVPLEDIIVYSSDTDFTPFDKGAYASSTTYISGTAVVQAATQVAERIKIRAAKMFLAIRKTSDNPHEISRLVVCIIKMVEGYLWKNCLATLHHEIRNNSWGCFLLF
jgi:putative selenate reductase molybdopterin-binding subunit